VNSSCARRFSRPPGWAHDFYPPPKPNPRRCCRWSISRPSSTGSKKHSPRASTTSSSSPARGKNAIEDHFDVNIELETFLEARGKRESARRDPQISDMINFAYVRQGEPLGLGHAVLTTRALVGDEPFAVILGDDVIDADPPALRQMVQVFDEVQGPVLAVERVAPRSSSAPTASSTPSRCKKASTASATWSRNRRRKKRPRTSPSSAATSSHPTSSRPSPRPAAIAPARFSSPTACASCCSGGRSTPARSRACGTTPGTSSAS